MKFASGREKAHGADNDPYVVWAGYAVANLERKYAGGSKFDVLNKPFTRQQQLSKMRQVVEGGLRLADGRHTSTTCESCESPTFQAPIPPLQE